jgi:hypothetical protein
METGEGGKGGDDDDDRWILFTVSELKTFSARGQESTSRCLQLKCSLNETLQDFRSSPLTLGFLQGWRQLEEGSKRGSAIMSASDGTSSGSHSPFCGTQLSIPARSAEAFQIDAATRTAVRQREERERGGRGRERRGREGEGKGEERGRG